MNSPSPRHAARGLALALTISSLVTSSTTFADSPKPAAAAEATAVLKVSGSDGKTMTFDAAALAKLPQQAIHAEAHGKAVNCTGPRLIDVVATVGAVSGEALRGKNLAVYVRASAADGYRAVFSLAELDPGMSGDGAPIVTASCDGHALDAKEGSFRIIAPRDKRPARWVRELTALDVLRAP